MRAESCLIRKGRTLSSQIKSVINEEPGKEMNKTNTEREVRAQTGPKTTTYDKLLNLKCKAHDDN